MFPTFINCSRREVISNIEHSKSQNKYKPEKLFVLCNYEQHSLKMFYIYYNDFMLILNDVKSTQFIQNVYNYTNFTFAYLYVQSTVKKKSIFKYYLQKLIRTKLSTLLSLTTKQELSIITRSDYNHIQSFSNCWKKVVWLSLSFSLF